MRRQNSRLYRANDSSGEEIFAKNGGYAIIRYRAAVPVTAHPSGANPSKRRRTPANETSAAWTGNRWKR
jgi:hypothetical protein